MNKLKLVIINKGDYKEAVKTSNNYFGEYNNNFIRVNIHEIKNLISDGLDYKKNALFDKIEEDIIKSALLSNFNVLLVAIDKSERYYESIENIVKRYNYLIDVDIKYIEVKQKNIFQKILKRIK